LPWRRRRWSLITSAATGPRRFRLRLEYSAQHLVAKGWRRRYPRHSQRYQSGRPFQALDERAQIRVPCQLPFQSPLLAFRQSAEGVKAGLFLLLLGDHT